MTHSTTKTSNAATDVIIDTNVIDNTVEQSDDLLREDELGYGAGERNEDDHTDEFVLVALYVAFFLSVVTSFSIGHDVVNNDGIFSLFSILGITIAALMLGVLPLAIIRHSMDWTASITQKAIFQRNFKWVAKKAGISEEAAKSLVLHGNYHGDRGTTRSYLRIDGETITLYHQLTKRSPRLKVVQVFQLDQEFHDMLKTEKATVEAGA